MEDFSWKDARESNYWGLQGECTCLHNGLFLLSAVSVVSFLKKRWSLYTSLVAHKAGTYPGFCSMKQLGIFLLSMDGMQVHHRATAIWVHLYTCIKKGTARVRYLAHEQNTMSRSGFQHGLLDPKSNALITAPPQCPTLPTKIYNKSYESIYLLSLFT